MIGFNGYQRWVAAQATPSNSVELSRCLIDSAHFISARTQMEIGDQMGLAKSIGGALWILARMATEAGLTLDEVMGIHVADVIRRKSLEQGVIIVREAV